MRLIHSKLLDALRRVQGFLDAQAAVLGALISAALRARLDGLVAQIAAFQVEQNTADGIARGETVNQADLRKTFGTAFVRPIAHIAKSNLKTSGDYPALSIAPSRLRKGDFIGAAQSMADAAAKYEKTFTDGGMPIDFLAQLRAAVAQLIASKDAQDRAVSRRAAATQGMAAANTTAKEVLAVLNGVIAPALKKNTSLLADWKSSKRIVPATTSLPSQPTGLPATNTDTTTPVVTDPATTGSIAQPAASAAAPSAPTTTASAVASVPQTAKPAV